VPADDVIQHGEEEDQERPAEEGQDAPNDLDPRLQAERAAAVTRVSTALAELDELRSDNYPAVQKKNCKNCWNKSK